MSSSVAKTSDTVDNNKRRCQHCFKRNSKKSPLLVCACKVAFYCDKECQKAEWKTHQKLCKLDKEIKEQIDPNTILANGLPVSNNHEIAKKWSQIHQTLFSVACEMAMDLRTYPSRIDTHLCMIEVSPTFDGTKIPKSKNEIARAFRLESIAILTFEDMMATVPLASEDLKEFLATALQSHRKEAEKYKGQGNKWSGVASIIISIPALHDLRIMASPQKRELCPLMPDWETIVGTILESGGV
ncbi:hypothetical protein CPB83DRAFT_837626 [Crepidotus variabilis]|uniref:MYND-type domain-containing protein n=1 Tax=Crepidotus variabilis TaxID=179855 RepID=A0A9P6JMB2_9AGAR|nr:hypothetical protein CPB83DRAFT_837626 [Crepidotus variabilis]